MRRQFWIMMLALAAIVPAGAPRAWTGEPISVGLSAPMTGNYAEYGNNWKKAMDIAVEKINQKGGIKGRPLQLVVEDSKSDPKERKFLEQDRFDLKRSLP